MNKKYYIKLMSANLFEEKKLSNKDQKENPLVQMINAAEEDNNARNINNHEKQNESKDKSSETGHPNNQSDGGTLNINININNSDNPFGNSHINNNSNNSLFDLSNNNKENSLFERTKINYNKTQGLFKNSTTQGNNNTYSSNENRTSDNMINQFEQNEKNDEAENTLAKIINAKDNENNIDASTIENRGKPDSLSDDSLIELKDKIPEISI